MYDAKIRRRRLVLLGLVAASLFLLTAFFGESVGGPFHTLQRGVVRVLSPIQEGASKALKPARDFVGWFGDTLDAKDERDDLLEQREELIRRLAAAETAVAENRELRAQLQLPVRTELDEQQPVNARVIARSGSLWYSRVDIDKGSSDGVRVDQPVIADGGLVGTVTSVTGSTAKVRLLTDRLSGVSASVLEGSRGEEFGSVRAEVGNPARLTIVTLPPRAKVREGDQVVTRGSISSELESLFPPGIPIGQISKVSQDELALSQTAQLEPYADLRHFDLVQVLTKPQVGLRAEVP